MGMRLLPWTVAVCLASSVALAQPPNLNTIGQVSVKGGSVEISGSRKPNFSTFTMQDPPRLVIDISEAVFSGVPEEIPVGNGVITAIRTASYGSDSAAIARVLIGFEKEMETDLQVVAAKKLVVKATPAAGTPVAKAPPAAAEPTAAASDAGTGTPKVVAAAPATEAPTTKTAAAAVPTAPSGPTPVVPASPEAKPAPALPPAAPVATAKAAEAPLSGKALAASATNALQDEDDDASALEALPAEESAPAAAKASTSATSAEDHKRAVKEAAARAAEEKKAMDAEARAARERAKEERAQKQAELREEKRRLAAEKAALRQQEAEERARMRRESKKVAMARTEAPSASEGALEPQAHRASGGRRTMTLVGFHPNGLGRVFVRTTEPVKFSVHETGEKTIVLELENTRIGSDANRLPLDTSFFNTSVALVQADPASRNVRVQIRLKDAAKYVSRQEGNEVSLQFETEP